MGLQPSVPCHRRHSPAVPGFLFQAQVWPHSGTHHPLPEPAFEALRESWAEVRALKEAVPIPMEIVMAWELGVLEHENQEPLKAILIWQMAIMAHASMRFDDALHTSPTLITVRGGGVELVSCQTKVGRKRRGTVFAVGSESLSGLPWLFTGLEVL